jgi:hypothetical protein
LHFLGTPQAFVLSQDQTLHKKTANSPRVCKRYPAVQEISLRGFQASHGVLLLPGMQAIKPAAGSVGIDLTFVELVSKLRAVQFSRFSSALRSLPVFYYNTEGLPCQ